MAKKQVDTIVILGGTSAVALAYARYEAAKGHSLCLVGRNKAALTRNAEDVKARGAHQVSTIVMDLGKSGSVQKNWQTIVEKNETVDRVLIAYGVLGEQSSSENEADALLTALETNFVSAALWAEQAYSYFAERGQGQLSVIGSVAGDRGRMSNYHYGAAKGGLDIFMSGMAHRAAKAVESDVGVLLVKPGFIDTPMTDHIDGKGGLLWATPDKIAKIILKAEHKGKTKIYAPWFWRFILLIIRLLPFFIFSKSSL